MNWYKEKRYISIPIEHWRSLRYNPKFQDNGRQIKFYFISEGEVANQQKPKQKYTLFRFLESKLTKPRPVQPLSGTFIDNRLEDKSVLFQIMAPKKPEIKLDDGGYSLLAKQYGKLKSDSFYLEEKDSMQAIMGLLADKNIISNIRSFIDPENFGSFISKLTGIDEDIVKSTLTSIQHQPEFSKAYLHYLNKTGSKRNYSYQEFLKSFPNVAKFYKEIVEETLVSVVSDLEKLGILYAKFQMSSNVIPISRWDFDRESQHVAIDQSINSDWNFALGDHFVWIGVDALVSRGKAIANLTINAESMFAYGLEHFVPSTKSNSRLVKSKQIFSMGASFNAGSAAAHPEHLTYSQISHQFARMELAKPYIQVGTGKLEIR